MKKEMINLSKSLKWEYDYREHKYLFSLTSKQTLELIFVKDENAPIFFFLKLLKK